MKPAITRREFIKIAALGLGTLAFRPYFGAVEDLNTGELARVAIKSVSIHSRPSDKSPILYQRFRDELLNVYETIVSDEGPGYNPVWYRVWRGYVHSAHLQTVRMSLNPVLPVPPETLQIAEVTVPFTEASLLKKSTGWQTLYRLYFGSTHWINGIDKGPDGSTWYRVHDELIDMDYHIPAEHLRPIPADELTPISPDVNPELKRIEISLTRQMLTAFEGDKIVLDTKISSGLPDNHVYEDGRVSTNTPTGNFNVQVKMASKHMGSGELLYDLDAYILPGVPWCCFFETVTGVATHGTYWHTNWGTPMSHGCINMKTDEAKWLYRWATPISPVDTIDKRGRGTQVTVK
jgi:hypothetical protein